MDNLAHALAGAALGQAGLKKQTGLAVATLVIAANLPDIDAIGGLFGRSLAWRRGWTHGPIALLVLPILLALAMAAFDRWQAGRGTRPATRAPVRFGGLLALAYIGILSHPLLDLVNTYGVRFLMPFSERWFYGDALFIIDIWLWSAFGLGVYLSRRMERRDQLRRAARPAIVSLVAVAAYAVAMAASSYAAERLVAREVVARGMPAPLEVVASPVPINPFRRRIAFDMGDALGFGDVRWTPTPRLTLEPNLVPTNMNDPAIVAAAGDRRVADFLRWSRLPFADIRRGPDGIHVTIGDARYNRTPGTGVFTVRTVVGSR